MDLPTVLLTPISHTPPMVTLLSSHTKFAINLHIYFAKFNAAKMCFEILRSKALSHPLLGPGTKLRVPRGLDSTTPLC